MKNLMNLFDEISWLNADEYTVGTKKKILRDEPDGKTILLKLPKDFYMPPHSHLKVEQNFVLEGEYSSASVLYPAGSYQIFSRGDEHGPFESKNGALILVIWDKI